MADNNDAEPGVSDSQQGEFRSGPVVGTALITGVAGGTKAVLYADVDGTAVFEGDIVLGAVADLQEQFDSGAEVVRGVIVTGQQFRWPGAQVPYEIDSGLPNQARVTDAIAHWQARTAIRFVERTAANAGSFPDFVHFVSGGGCSSQVGRRGGSQDITLGDGCSTGNAIHEIGHTVGLWHEQSREDRDSFVTIQWANIDPAMQHNFSQHITDGDDVGPYDFGSIMHYPRTAFSVNGQDTIVPRSALPPGVVMGQRDGLSAGDIAAVNFMYPPVAPPTIKELPKDPITDPPVTIKEVTSDPTTIKELAKDPILDPPVTIKEVPADGTTIKELAKDPVTDTVKEISGDPGPVFPGPGPGPLVQPFRPAGQPASFIVTTPHQFPGFGDQPAPDQLATTVALLADALSLAQQSAATLAGRTTAPLRC